MLGPTNVFTECVCVCVCVCVLVGTQKYFIIFVLKSEEVQFPGISPEIQGAFCFPTRAVHFHFGLWSDMKNLLITFCLATGLFPLVLEKCVCVCVCVLSLEKCCV